MNLRNSLYIVLFAYAFLLIGCNEEHTKKKSENIQPVSIDQLINWELFNDESFHNISFPVWFNNNQVTKNNLSEVKISLFRYHEEVSVRTPKDTFPDEVWNFRFNDDGWVEEIVFQEFAEAIKIATHHFEYKSNPDSVGYSSPLVNTRYLFNRNKSSFQGILDQVEDLKVFNRLIYEKRDSVAIIYKNALSTLNEKHIFLKDSSSWNVHFIDQNYSAEGKHYYYYGLPNSYNESFKLVNLVEKSLSQKRFFYPNQVIKSQEFYSGGFYRDRSFVYDTSGWCKGFKDSIFSSGHEFIYAEKASIERNTQELPVALTFFDLNDTLKNNQKKRYKISYLQKTEP